MNRTVSLGLALLLSVIGLQAEEPTELQELVVRAEDPKVPGEVVLGSEDMLEAGAVNVAEAVALSVPGVAAVRRNADAAEPVLRGLGWERVETQVGCLSLYGACPARMDPPASYVSPETVEAAQVILALPSVTLGPGGTAGRVMIGTDYDRGAAPGRELLGGARFTWNQGRDGYAAGLYAKGGGEDLDFRLEGNATDLGDYETGDGRTVPANNEESRWLHPSRLAAGGSCAGVRRLPAEGSRRRGLSLAAHGHGAVDREHRDP